MKVLNSLSFDDLLHVKQTMLTLWNKTQEPVIYNVKAMFFPLKMPIDSLVIYVNYIQVFFISMWDVSVC